MAENDDDSNKQSQNTSVNNSKQQKSPRKSEKFTFSGCNHHVSSDNSDDESSDSESSSSDITLPPPPDGGWGWIVVAASFVIHFIADGYAFSFGVLYTELLDYFQESKGKTAWVGSLFVSVPLLAGPIASALTNKYGCRAITIAGSITASVGLIASTFSTSTDMLCLTFGVISGFGLSMVYVPAVVIVAFYFEKKRAFATGIAVAGSGIGNCVFAPLIEVLIQMYSWRGAVLILGGVMLQLVACGALFRPLVPPSVEKKRRRLLSERSSHSRLSSTRHSSDDVCGMPSGVSHSGEQNQHLMTNSMVQFPTYVNKKTTFITVDLLKDLKQNRKSIHEYLAENNLLDKFYAVQSLTDCSNGASMEMEEGVGGGFSIEDKEEEGEDDPETVSSSAKNNANSDIAVNGSQIHSPDGSSNSELVRSNGHVIEKSSNPNPPLDSTPLNERESFSNPEVSKKPMMMGCASTVRADELWLGKVRPRFKRTEVQGQFTQPLSRKDIFYRGNLQRPGAFFSGRAVSCPDVFLTKPTEDTEEKELFCRFKVFSLLQVSKEVKHFMKTMLDPSIFKNLIFIYFCLSCMFLYISYDVPYVYTVDKAIHELGIDEKKASLLLSIIGLTSMFGQIVIGYIGDQSCVDTLHLYNALTSIAGICTMLVPLMMSYAWLCVFCASYGFFISANYALTTIILVDLMSMDKLTNAYGVVMLAEGIANVIGPPLAGWLSDFTGSYDLTFICAGFIMVLSGVMLFAIPFLRRYERRNHCDSDSDVSMSVRKSDQDLQSDTVV